MFVKCPLASCLYIWVVCASSQGLYLFITFIFTSERLPPFIYFFSWEWVCVRLCVCRSMCNWAKTILKGDIRDGWITENLLKRDNPSCTLIRHTPWFSNGIFSIISAVTVIPSRHSAQQGSLSLSLSLLTPFFSSLFLLLLPCPWLCTNCEPFRLPW